MNAPIVTLRAPIAGDLEIHARPLGAVVARDDLLARIEDPLVDRVRLDDLLMELRLEEAALSRFEGMLEAEIAIRAALVQRGQEFRTARLDDLRTRLAHAQERLALLEERHAQNESLDLVDADARLLSAVEIDTQRLPAEPRIDALVLSHARERVEVLQVELDAAERSVFIGNSQNNAPNSEQRVLLLNSEISALEQQHIEAKQRLAAVSERVEQERRRVTLMSGHDLHAPVTGLLWEILEADEVNVQRGDPLIRIVDCEALLVTLSVTERIYNRLELGQSAKFRLGGSTTVYDATILRLAGSGAATIYEHLAVAPSERHLERYDVTILVPDLGQSAGMSCPIGRTGRVFFETRPLDWLRSLLRDYA